jgi:hypothetical protein
MRDERRAPREGDAVRNGSHVRLISRSQTGGMPFVIRTIFAMAVAIAAVAAMASLASTLADVLGGIVVLVAILVLMRAIMAFAAEPGESGHHSGRRR